MRLRTAGALLLILLGLGAALTYSPGQSSASDGELTEEWVSDPPPDLQSNHHSPAAAFVDGETYVAVPINSRQGTLCVVSVLDGEGDLRWRDEIPQDRCTVHAVSDPAIEDFDGDGQREVVAATSGKEVLAYDLDTGDVEMRHELGSYGYSKPVVANLTAADGPETVVVDLLGGVSVLRPDGTVEWKRTFEDARVRQPAVRDFDADGAPELAIGQLTGAVVVLERDGSVAWRRNVTDSVVIKWMEPGRMDDDAAVELVVSTFTGRILALDGRDGTVEWERDLGATGATVHAVGDGDGDGQAEVYAAARDGKIRSLDASDGTVEWTTTLTTEPVAPMPPPSLGDVDGDGDAELVAVSNTGLVAVVDPATGEILASYEREVAINTFARVTDLDGDGAQEVLVIYDDGRVVALSYG